MNFSAFDVIGPAMIGPSSSHTAGAARIGLAARLLLGHKVEHADIGLHGSFAATGKGHATDRALVAGLLGMSADDERLKNSLELASDAGMNIHFQELDLGEEAHPNSVKLSVTSADKHTLTILACSVGGGMIKVRQIDEFDTSITGELETLIIWHIDQPGYLAKVTTIFDCVDLNIATARLSRSSRGETALTTIESDGKMPDEGVSLIRFMPATHQLRTLVPQWRPPAPE